MRATQMPRTRGAVARRSGLRGFWTSPLLVAALATGVVSAVVLARAAVTVHDASALRRQIHELAARVAAEESALAFVQSDGSVDRRAVDAGNGLYVETAVRPIAETSQLRLTAAVAEQQFEFVFQRLDGGTPLPFGHALTLGPDAAVPPEWVEDDSVRRLPMPAIADVEVSPPEVVAAVAGEDAGLALLRFSAGTDRADYVLGAGRGEKAPQAPESGVVRVPGNLWVDSVGAPLELHLHRDLTILVDGNVYLGRSVRVRGQGRLLVATTSADSAFADLDGNGRWSHGEPRASNDAMGPVEGCGNVYLGLPRESADLLDFDLGLVCVGNLHVAARRAVVHGPVMLGGNGVRLGTAGSGQLVCTGLRLPSLRRTALPGFAVVGRPRPSALVPVSRDLPLYSAAPGR